MSTIPFCPLLSAGSDKSMVCLQESCAWYMKNYKTCSMYLIAHNAVLDIKAKQASTPKNAQNTYIREKK